MPAESPPRAVPPAAARAWHAYRDMLDSKQAHFGELARLNARRQEGATVTLAETAYLARLLEAHDDCVRRFRDEMTALAARDAEARRVLLDLIAAANRDLGGPEASH